MNAAAGATLNNPRGFAGGGGGGGGSGGDRNDETERERENDNLLLQRHINHFLKFHTFFDIQAFSCTIFNCLWIFRKMIFILIHVW